MRFISQHKLFGLMKKINHLYLLVLLSLSTAFILVYSGLNPKFIFFGTFLCGVAFGWDTRFQIKRFWKSLVVAFAAGKNEKITLLIGDRSEKITSRVDLPVEFKAPARRFKVGKGVLIRQRADGRSIINESRLSEKESYGFPIQWT